MSPQLWHVWRPFVHTWTFAKRHSHRWSSRCRTSCWPQTACVMWRESALSLWYGVFTYSRQAEAPSAQKHLDSAGTFLVHFFQSEKTKEPLRPNHGPFWWNTDRQLEQRETKTSRAESVTLISTVHHIHVQILFGFLNVTLHLRGNVKTQFLRHGQGNHGRSHHVDPLPVKENTITQSVALKKNGTIVI